MIKEFKKGDKVICVLNNRASLTIGKEYEIVAIDYDKISVTNDYYSECNYDPSRFILISTYRDYTINQILE
jgi:hypothetical protein